jgi:putative intracellular protease/amidase
MQRGLEGRRIALFATPGGVASELVNALGRAFEEAGATVHSLASSMGDEDWQGARYAALVLLGGTTNGAQPRLVQLVREFLVADKPLVAVGGAVQLLLSAGGVKGRHIAASGTLRDEIQDAGATCVDGPVNVDDALITVRDGVAPNDLASQVVRALSGLLEERTVDEMSDLSFPASDPPAATPASVGHVARDPDTRP